MLRWLFRLFEEQRVIDFRVSQWGHSCVWKHTYGNFVDGHFFYNGEVEKGDYLLIKGKKGQYKVKITQLENCKDPWDMHFFEAKWIEDL